MKGLHWSCRMQKCKFPMIVIRVASPHFLSASQHQEDISVMDIRLLVEAIMETAGKIKNDNMSNQDFYKLQLIFHIF